jgi:hypothetical protein
MQQSLTAGSRIIRGVIISGHLVSARKLTKSLLTAITIFVLAFLPTGLAHAEPGSSSSSPEISRVQIDQLANGKTRVQLALPQRMKGKTVVIRSARLIDGSRWTVVLGKAKVRPSGKVIFTTSRTVRVQDQVLVQNKNRNVLREVVIAIGKPESAPTPPSSGSGGSSGSGSSSAQPPTQSAESAAQRYLEGGGDPNSAAYLNLRNYIENGGSTGQLDQLLTNLEVTLRCGTGGTCPELGAPPS